MKKRTLLLWALFSLSFINAQNANIPSGLFKNYLLNDSQINKNRDQEISLAEASAVETITIYRNSYRGGGIDPNLDDITGIEQFENLKHAAFIMHEVKVADLSKNTQLETLYISYAGATPLDLTKNIKLNSLSLITKQLDIDLSTLTQLQKLSIHSINTSQIDLSHNSLLTDLRCTSNRLTAIDLSNNPLLQSLTINYTQIDTLDVSHQPLLNSVTCNYNKNLKTLNFSNASLLQYLDCNYNKLKNLLISNSPQLSILKCTKNELGSLDVSKNSLLTYIDCDSNNLKRLDLSPNTLLQSLNCNQNNIETLEVSNCANLTKLWCQYNLVPNLDLQSKLKLIDLKCSHNKLTYLKLPPMKTVPIFDCSYNKLTKLDLSTFEQIDYQILCNNNELTEIIFPESSVFEINCSYNRLQALDLKNPSRLNRLNCSYNLLQNLNISKANNLYFMYCFANPNLSLICIPGYKNIGVGDYKKDSTAVWSLCKPETPAVACATHVTPTGLCEDFYDAEPSTANHVDEYVLETNKTRWENGAPVVGEHAYMGMFWTEASDKNGFTAIKNRKGNGVLEYTISQRDTVYEPFLLVFGSYANDHVEQKLTVDLSANKTLSFDLKNTGDSVISVYVQMEDIHGNNLMFDENEAQLGTSDLISPYGIGWYDSEFTCPMGKSTFNYDCSHAICGKTEMVYDNFYGREILQNVAHPEIQFDFSQVSMIKFFVSGYKNIYWKSNLVHQKIEISNFVLGDPSILTTLATDTDIDQDIIYTAYDLMGQYIGTGLESQLKLQTNQVYILKSNKGVKKKMIVEKSH